MGETEILETPVPVPEGGLLTVTLRVEVRVLVNVTLEEEVTRGVHGAVELL